jgi:hypothetical protein
MLEPDDSHILISSNFLTFLPTFSKNVSSITAEKNRIVSIDSLILLNNFYIIMYMIILGIPSNSLLNALLLKYNRLTDSINPYPQRNSTSFSNQLFQDTPFPSSSSSSLSSDNPSHSLDFLANLPNIQTIALAQNFLTSFPSSITLPSTLTSIDLSLNNFISIPHQLAILPHLNTLNMAFNDIKNIPSWLLFVVIIFILLFLFIYIYIYFC